MSTSFLFLTVFFVQVVVVSLVLPILFVKKVRGVLDAYPADAYPKLYPVSENKIDSGLKRFLVINNFVLGVGLLIIAHALFTQPDDLLGWDNKGVVSTFFFLQMIPVIFAEFSGFQFFKKMREQNRVNKRYASLKPKSWLQYFSKPVLIVIAVLQVTFIAMVAYYQQNPFQGFGGYYNLIGLAFMDIVFVLVVRWAVYGKKVDPLQPEDVKTNQVQTIINILAFSHIFAVSFVIINLFMAASALRPYIDVTICLYNTVLMAIGYQWFTKIDIDFDVYKAGETSLPHSEQSIA